MPRSRILGGFVLPLALLLIGVVACGPKYPKCKKDSHCAEKGEVCVDGLCQQCRDATQCKGGDQCVGGRCEPKPECVNNTDCKGGQVCRSGKCEIECTTSGDCGSGRKCVGNRCVDEMSCASNDDCGAGMGCVGGRCQTTLAGRKMGCELATVNFEFNQSRLTSQARDALERNADCLKSMGGTVVIEGHADERGTEEYNLALGEERGNAARKYLIDLGVPGSKLRVVSKGELEPADQGHDEAAWGKNRRAEFIER